jgi:putative ABC transport system substrate-binding protein
MGGFGRRNDGRLGAGDLAIAPTEAPARCQFSTPSTPALSNLRDLLAGCDLGLCFELRHCGKNKAYGYATASAQKATRSVPIVFASVTDPVGGGLVASLARPGGNTTGFISSEFAFAGKWLELLKEVAPRVTRVAVLRNAAIASQIALFGSIQSVAASVGVEVRPIDTRDADEIESDVTAFAGEPNGGLIAASGAGVIRHRELIVALAAQYRLPAVYAYRGHVMSGGLISYGSDQVENFRQAAGYVSRILKGEKPADLPVQQVTKVELIVNLKTAMALGLTIPLPLLGRADEVIE